MLVRLVLATSCLAAPAMAQSSSADKAAAEGLFAEGRRLMEAGRFAQACPKFEASQRLDPGVGTMLNLAECYEKTGKTASAWAEFREVISAARAADSAEREALARQRATALEARLSRLTIELSPEAAATHGIEVRRDGALVDPAELGSGIPVDPGKHVVEATAPGKAKWFKTLELPGDGSIATLTIPPLEAAVESNGVSPVVTASQPRPSDAAQPTSSGSSQKTFALIAGGVGVVGVGIGTVFGLQASAKLNDAKKACPAYPACSGNTAADQLNSDAKNAATLSTIGFIVGAVGVATGVTLWLTAGPSESAPGTALVVGPGGVALNGRF